MPAGHHQTFQKAQINEVCRLYHQDIMTDANLFKKGKCFGASSAAQGAQRKDICGMVCGSALKKKKDYLLIHEPTRLIG